MKNKKFFVAMFAMLFSFVIAAMAMGGFTSMSILAASDDISWQKEGYYGVMSFNLRYNEDEFMKIQYGDSDTEHGRGFRAIRLINKYSPDIIGFQEATDNWMKFFRTFLVEAGYSYEGVGRDNGLDDTSRTGTGNEFSSIFYKTDKFEKLEGGTFWLSNTPDVKSGTQWGASNVRICTYVVLKDKQTGDVTIHFNTHLDHVSIRAKLNGFRLIEARVALLLEKYPSAGLVGTGDFNTTSHDSNNPDYVPETYNLMIDNFDDARTIADSKVVDRNTTNGYGTGWDDNELNTDFPSVDTEGYPIDYILLGKGMYNVDKYTVCDEFFDFIYDGKTYIDHPVSDHYPVFALVKQTSQTRAASNGATAAAKGSVVESGTTADALSDGIIQGINAYENLALNENADVTLDLSTSVAQFSDITNMLSSNSSSAVLSVESGNSAVFAELTVKLNDTSCIKAISITAANLNGTMEVAVPYSTVSHFGRAAKLIQNGDGQYYIVLNSCVDASQIKIFIPNATDGLSISNISVYGVGIATDYKKAMPSDIEFISGEKSGESENEGSRKLFDNDVSTKFYYNGTSKPQVEPIIFKLNSAEKVIAYSIFNANDNETQSGRTIRGWELSGSNDGNTWTLIDSHSNMTLENTNYKEFNFVIDESKQADYEYYKFEITQIGTNSRVQLSELQLHLESDELGIFADFDEILANLGDLSVYHISTLKEFFAVLKSINRNTTDSEQINSYKTALLNAIEVFGYENIDDDEGNNNNNNNNSEDDEQTNPTQSNNNETNGCGYISFDDNNSLTAIMALLGMLVVALFHAIVLIKIQQKVK